MDERNAALHRSGERLRRRLEEIGRRRDRVVDAFVQDRAIDRATYEEQIARLDQERVAVLDQLGSHTPTAVDVNATLHFAESLLADLTSYWNRLGWRQKPGILTAIFPGGLSYAGGAIGTMEKSWLFGVFDLVETPEGGLAPPTGFEPVLPP